MFFGGKIDKFIVPLMCKRVARQRINRIRLKHRSVRHGRKIQKPVVPYFTIYYRCFVYLKYRNYPELRGSDNETNRQNNYRLRAEKLNGRTGRHTTRIINNNRLKCNNPATNNRTFKSQNNTDTFPSVNRKSYGIKGNTATFSKSMYFTWIFIFEYH